MEAAVKTYKFEDLSEEAQERAIGEHRSIWIDNPDWDSAVIDSMYEVLKENGFSDTEVRFYRDNDINFAANFDIEFVLSKLPAKLAHQARILQAFCGLRIFSKLGSDSCLSVGYSVHVETNFRCTDSAEQRRVVETIQELEDAAQQIYCDQCVELKEVYRAEYEWLTSDEEVSNWLDGSGIDFTEDGETV
jgi:hypothetical protein